MHFGSILNKFKNNDKISIEFSKEELYYILEALDVTEDIEYFCSKEDDRIISDILGKIQRAVEGGG